MIGCFWVDFFVGGIGGFIVGVFGLNVFYIVEFWKVCFYILKVFGFECCFFDYFMYCLKWN